jgi:hypothetical protein
LYALLRHFYTCMWYLIYIIDNLIHIPHHSTSLSCHHRTCTYKCMKWSTYHTFNMIPHRNIIIILLHHDLSSLFNIDNLHKKFININSSSFIHNSSSVRYINIIIIYFIINPINPKDLHLFHIINHLKGYQSQSSTVNH